MKIIGFVGKVCAGKTTIARSIVQKNSIIDPSCLTIHIEGDAEISEIYKNNSEVISKIQNLYPDCIVNGEIDRKKLGNFFFESTLNQSAVENIVHPVLKQRLIEKINQFRSNDNCLIILDVPILFKLSMDLICNHIIVFDANKDERIDRYRERVSNYFSEEGQILERFSMIDSMHREFYKTNKPYELVNTDNQISAKEEAIEGLANLILKIIS